MNSIKRTAVICFLVIPLVSAQFILKHFAFAKDIPQDDASVKSDIKEKQQGKPLLNKGYIQQDKPLAVKEWEKVWGDIWNNEAKELKQQGLSDENIITKLNPLVAERVAKNLKMDQTKIEKIVYGYFESLNKSKVK